MYLVCHNIHRENNLLLCYVFQKSSSPESARSTSSGTTSGTTEDSSEDSEDSGDESDDDRKTPIKHDEELMVSDLLCSHIH